MMRMIMIVYLEQWLQVLIIIRSQITEQLRQLLDAISKEDGPALGASVGGLDNNIH